MAPKIKLTLAIHSHQPAGNFDHVFEQSMERCYEPFLAVLERHPGIRLTLHYSGCLLEWIENHRPAFLDRLAGVVERGQVELLGSGFFEPILSSLRQEDAVSQILLMNEYLKKRFGKSAEGIWLTERVWDPGLPRILHAAGIRFTLVDDTHFRHAGLEERDLHGYYITEASGSPLAVFPIDKMLRYAIPFAEPGKTVERLQQLRAEGGANAVCYGDDGEKFGIWPDTYAWVYEQGWLGRFFETLERAQDQIRLATFSEVLVEEAPRGRVYLPLASYDEMMEWAILNPEMGQRFSEFVQQLKNRGEYERYRPFVRGGAWPNFLAKYPESDAMNKKAIFLSRQIDRLHEGEAAYEQARCGIKPPRELLHVWRAQCNCGYWHGLFGGLYLNYLRHAIYANLIAAQKEIDRQQNGDGGFLDVQRVDTDLDLAEEVIVNNPLLTVHFNPTYGGSVQEIDYKPASFCLTNVLARRIEAYHLAQAHAEDCGAGDPNAPKTIHDQRTPKVSNWRDYVVQDPHRRYSFLDRFLPPGTEVANLKNPELKDETEISNPYKVLSCKTSSKTFTLSMAREALLIRGDQRWLLTITKDFSLDPKSGEMPFAVTIHNQGESELHLLYGLEWNFTVLDGHNEDRRYNFKGTPADNLFADSEGTVAEVTEAGLSIGWDNAQWGLRFSAPCRLYRYPIHTISQSESGLEKTYQGSSLIAINELHLSAGKKARVCGVFYAKPLR